MNLRFFTLFVFALSLFLSTLFLTPAKAQTPIATPAEATPTVSPALSRLTETTVGLPGGDCFEPDPYTMTIDPTTGRLYLMCRSTGQENSDALLVLDSRTNKQIAFIRLDETWFPPYARNANVGTFNFLVLDAPAQRLYLSNIDWLGILVLDTTSLTKIRWLPVESEEKDALAIGQNYLYVREANGLVAYRTDTFSQTAHVSPQELPLMGYFNSGKLVYNPNGPYLYITTGSEEKLGLEIQVRHSETLALQARLALPDQSLKASAFDNQTNRWYLLTQYRDTGKLEIQIRRGDDLVLETTLPLPNQAIGFSVFDSQHQRWYILSRSQDYPTDPRLPIQYQLLAVEGQTSELTSLDLTLFDSDPNWPRLLVDETTGQVHLIRSTNWLIVNGQSLAILAQHQLTDYCPDAYAGIDPPGKLFVLCKDTLLHRFDLLTGRPDQPLLLGRPLVTAITHPQDGRLYFIDSLGTLTVLDGTSLQPLKRRPDLIGRIYLESLSNSTPYDRIYLALDPERQRLFVGDQRITQTLVLDLETLDTVDQLPVVGPMAVDSAGGRLFLADDYPGEEGKTFIHTFDTATLAELQPAGNPTGEISKYPRESIQDLTFAQPTGSLFLYTSGHSEQSGGSGSGSWRFYSLYDPDTMTYLEDWPTESLQEWARSVAFSSDGQRTYMAFAHKDGLYFKFQKGSSYPIFRGLLILDQAGRLLRQINGPFGPLAMDDQFIYVLQDQYLLALDTQALETPNQPYLAAVLPLEHTYNSLALVQDRLYLWGRQQAALIPTAELLTHLPPPSLPADLFETVPTLPSLAPIGHLGGRSGSVVVQGRYAYAAFGPEVAVLDINNPTQPQRLGYILLPNMMDGYYNVIHHLAVAGDYVYAATEQAGLRIIDVSNPTAPREVGFYAPNFPWATQTIHQIAVAGSYAYLAAGEWGLRILDISNPARPTEVGFYEFEAVVKEWLPGSVQDVAVVKKADRTYVYVLVLDGASGFPRRQLHLLDVSDPTRPTELNLASSFIAQYLETEDHFLYLTNTGPEDHPVGKTPPQTVLDISNPTTPVEVSFNPDLDFPYRGDLARGTAALAGEYILVSTETALNVMDISSPTAPREIGAYAANLDDIDSMAVSGTYAYLAQGANLSITDLSDPTQPAVVGTYKLNPASPDFYEVRRLSVVDEYLYVLDPTSLQILDITRPTTPVPVKSFDTSATSPQDMVVVGDKVYLITSCAQSGGNLQGIWVLNASKPPQPVEEACYPMPPGKFFVKGQDIYVVAGARWGRLDLSNLARPALHEPPFSYDSYYISDYNFEVTPPYLYLVRDQLSSYPSFASLQVIDLSDQFNPLTVGVYQAFRGLYGAEVVTQGEYSYLTSHAGLFIFRLSSPP